MDKRKSKWKIIIIPLYAVIILLAGWFLASYADADAGRLFLSPLLESARGWDIYRLKDGNKESVTIQELSDNRGETVYLSRTLDKDLEQEGYTILELDGRGWQESVFLDGELLYTVRPEIDNRLGFVEFPKEYTGLQEQGEYVRLSLPPDYGGKTLTLAVARGTAEDSYSLPMIRLSSENIQTQLFVSDANRLAIPATAYLLAALLVLGLFFYNWYHGQHAYAMLLLAAAALAQALRAFLNFDFYFPSHFSLNVIPAELLPILVAVLPLLYLLAQMRRYRKYYAPVVWIPFIICTALRLLAHFPRLQGLAGYTTGSLMLLYVPLLLLLVFSALEWRDNNPVYRLFTPIFFLVLLCLLAAAAGLSLTGRRESWLLTLLLSPDIMTYEILQYSGGILLFLAMAISLILTVKKAADTESAFSAMSVRNELVSENLHHMQESVKEIAAMRHDMLRHLHTILDLSHEGNKELLESYLSELTKETEAILPLKVCEHPVVNALVTRALAMAEKEHVRIELHVEVPAGITVSDNDLCVLIMNMLDNAIEATASLPEESKRTIQLTMHVRGRYLFVETMNACEETLLLDKKSGLPLSRKGSGHGYGMKAISDIAVKYNSRLQFKQEQGRVTVRTALLMPFST